MAVNLIYLKICFEEHYDCILKLHAILWLQLIIIWGVGQAYKTHQYVIVVVLLLIY